MTPTRLRHWQWACIIVAACTAGRAQTPATTGLPAPQDFLRSHMDFAADPGVDFFHYANGTWLAHNPIPAATLRSNLLSDVHSPAKWRVLGPLSTVPEFYQAFGIKPGQPMWRPESERVYIW